MPNILHELDDITLSHQKRVAIIAKKIAQELGITGKRLETLTQASLIHDIGKMCVPQEILDKPGRPTNEEFEKIKEHTVAGADICRKKGYSEDTIKLVKHHHELLNGNGYPDGLKGAEISLENRILTVADKFEALTAKRQYKPSLKLEEARDILKNNANNGEIDKKVLDTLNKIIDRKLDQQMNNNNSFKLQEDLKGQYKAEYHVSQETALLIKEINKKFGRNLSLSEIKELRQKIGRAIEENQSNADMELFKKLDNIVTDLKKAQLTEKQNISKQHKTHIQAKSIDNEL